MQTLSLPKYAYVHCQMNETRADLDPETIPGLEEGRVKWIPIYGADSVNKTIIIGHAKKW